MTKDEIKEMLETIENDSELKDKFCNMMDTYRSKIWYKVGRESPADYYPRKRTVVPAEDVPKIETKIINQKEINYLKDPKKWNDDYILLYNATKCEVTKGEDFKYLFEQAVDNNLYYGLFLGLVED